MTVQDQSGVTERRRLALKRTDLLKQAALIGGQWRSADATIEVRNPATGRLLGEVPDLSEAGASDAVAAAETALPAWSRMTAKARGDILRRWAELILAHQEDLARLMTAEQGKPLAEARGEVAYSAAFFEWFAEEGRRAYGEIVPANQEGRKIVVSREPVGVVAAITPWNFPSAMIARKAAPALAAGCAFVCKPSELTPFSALAMAALGQEAGLPDGVFSVVTGRPGPIGEVFTGDQRVAKFTFTGSTAVGAMLAARCMATVKRVSLELGGNAPFLVFDDADIEAAVEGAVLSKFRNAGQTCVCANRFLVQDRVADAFAEALQSRASRLVVGDGLEGPTDQGPLINEAAVAKVERHLRDALEGGGRLLLGGGRDAPGQTFFAPTVVSEVRSTALINREETFGPLAGIVRFADDAEGLALANAGRAGLAAYLYSRDVSRAWRAADALRYGMVGVNTGIISTEVAPFGGMRESGIGREGSRHGLDEYLEIKATHFAL